MGVKVYTVLYSFSSFLIQKRVVSVSKTQLTHAFIYKCI